jgi:Tfp pilus assembly protein PilV
MLTIMILVCGAVVMMNMQAKAVQQQAQARQTRELE